MSPVQSTITTHGEDADAHPRCPVFLAAFWLHEDKEHHAISVRTSTAERGWHIFHINGWMGAPLNFEVKRNEEHPLLSISCLYIQQIGWVSRGNLDKIEPVCRAIRPTERLWDGTQDIIAARSNPDWVADAIEELRVALIIEPLGVEDNGGRVRLLSPMYP
ncbi:hypothetical protein CONLIGDRAFT_647157 [Coniochaeta ligniaria NRRL 30616]|uniref:Uncharacterized protein n=1 Tax=Coniochaeta ligniaria NRRL 30616 TaxID=1408157 RepID=A0A1J7IHW0_9PEZI|nr:hypothetical protein CONLIGDRAFT_647157 [Coniochaeta ligniaria NRRL 30616]